MMITWNFTHRVACLAVLCLAAVSPTFAFEGPKTSPEREQELLAVLRSEAPPAEKAITCKLLAIHGSSEAVPDLAKLLPDPQLASWARIALEVIPGSAADEALRKATDSLQGNLLVGTINSIGVRRDANSVSVLGLRLNDPDVEVASAAAVALGRIGNADAEKFLLEALSTPNAKTRTAVAEGCVLCAERMLAAGNDTEAVKIFDQVRATEVPKQRILEATRGAILARKEGGVALLIETLESKEKPLFNIALTTAREFPGAELDQALATAMTKETPDRAALIVQAMADRPTTVQLPAILAAAEQGPKPVRLAAVNALARVGNASCLAALLAIAVEADAELAQSARTALADLPGDVNSGIVALLPKADGKSYPVLIELIGQRRIEAAADFLLTALDHDEAKVRQTALAALGETVAPKGLSVLVAQYVKPKHAEDAEAAQKALRAAAVRMPDREVCAAELSAAMTRCQGETRASLLEILGEVGGTKALETIGLAAKGNDPLLLDASSQLLGKWMTLDAAPVLLDLVKSAPGEKYQTRALRGYIRIARQFVLPETERAAMCQKALEASDNAAEHKLVLEILRRYPHIDTLKVAVNASSIANLKEDARQAVLVIAQKVGTNSPEVSELLAKAGVAKVKLELIKAEYGSGTTRKDVTEILKKQVGELPYLSLPANTYNGSFGGDPAPNQVKQLKIQYKLNDKEGEATFAENALIVLPKP